MAYGNKGSIRIVPTNLLEQEEAAVAAARDEAAMGAWAARWVNCWPAQGEFEPEPGAEASGRVAGVQQFLTSVLCAAGGTRWAGKAPRGQLARKLNKRAGTKD